MLDKLQQKLQAEGSLTLTLRCRPGASKTQIKSAMTDGSIKIDVAAAPEDGRANGELVAYLAEVFDVSVMNITILTGQTNRQKVLHIQSQ